MPRGGRPDHPIPTAAGRFLTATPIW